MKIVGGSSSIRTWLNNEFLENSFSENEIELIKKTLIQNDKNSIYGTWSGANTKDKFFLLSESEFANLAHPSLTKGLTTLYARNQHCYYYSYFDRDYYNEYIGKWWLRTSGDAENTIMCVNIYGELSKDGFTGLQEYMSNGIWFGFGIRPAIWVSVD